MYQAQINDILHGLKPEGGGEVPTENNWLDVMQCSSCGKSEKVWKDKAGRPAYCGRSKFCCKHCRPPAVLKKNMGH